MFTQCPECSTVYEISTDHLAAAGGMVRCGECDTMFNALRRLSETAPAPDSSHNETSAPNTATELDANDSEALSQEAGAVTEQPVATQNEELTDKAVPEAESYFQHNAQSSSDQEKLDHESEVTADSEIQAPLFDSIDQDDVGDEETEQASLEELMAQTGTDKNLSTAQQQDTQTTNLDAQNEKRTALPNSETAVKPSKNPDDFFATSQVLDEWDIEEGEHDLEALLDEIGEDLDEKKPDDDESAASDVIEEALSDSADDENPAAQSADDAPGDDNFIDDIDALIAQSENDLSSDALNDAAIDELLGDTDKSIDDERLKHDVIDSDEEHADSLDNSDDQSAENRQENDAGELIKAADADAAATDSDVSETQQRDDQALEESPEETLEVATDNSDLLTEDATGEFDEEFTDHDEKQDLRDLGNYLTPRKSLVRRLGETTAVVGLLAALGGQYVHQHRADLATDPRFGPTLHALYERAGLTLEANWRIDDYRVARHTVVPKDEDRSVLLARATVINNTENDLPMPLVRLELRNRWGDAIFGRLFTPEEYSIAKPNDKLLAGGARLEIELDLVNPALDQDIGYDFSICVPRNAGPDCGNLTIFKNK